MLQLCVCDLNNEHCMLHHCDACPDMSNVADFLKSKLDANEDDVVKYKQWVSTDRSNLVDKEEFVEDFVSILCEMLYQLTEHHFISKKQNAYMKDLKSSLKPNESIIVLDFAENYAFVVQDAAQSFHWNNSQATIHPFVVYFINPETHELSHKAFACISDHMTHDTAAVYTFVSVLLNDYLKPQFPHIEKVHYFSDGCCAQYKNYKNFANLIFHEHDFQLKAEWNFFATSHGKNSCDGVGGTIKRLAARASLQRPLSDQILTPFELFQFATESILNITSFFVESGDVTRQANILEPRFSNATRFKGTRKHHKFIPQGNEISMSRVSGGSALSYIQSNEIDITMITPGSYYACRYDGDWFFCIVNFVSLEHHDVNVKFLHPKGPAKSFFWPEREDICWVPLNEIICKVDPPSAGSSARSYGFSQSDVQRVVESI